DEVPAELGRIYSVPPTGRGVREELEHADTLLHAGMVMESRAVLKAESYGLWILTRCFMRGTASLRVDRGGPRSARGDDRATCTVPNSSFSRLNLPHPPVY